MINFTRSSASSPNENELQLSLGSPQVQALKIKPALDGITPLVDVSPPDVDLDVQVFLLA